MAKKLIVLCRIVFMFLGIHKTRVLALLCSDFHFFKATLKLYRLLDIGWPDEIKIPGGPMWVVKRESLVLKWIKALHGLHKFEEILLIAHGGCGAYKLEGHTFSEDAHEQSHHENELRKARDVIMEIMPNVKVRLVYARLTSKQKLIEHIEVK